MGIKNIHLVLIILGLFLAFGLGVWSFKHQTNGLAITSFITCGALLIYTISFIRKIKSI